MRFARAGRPDSIPPPRLELRPVVHGRLGLRCGGIRKRLFASRDRLRRERRRDQQVGRRAVPVGRCQVPRQRRRLRLPCWISRRTVLHWWHVSIRLPVPRRGCRCGHWRRCRRCGHGHRLCYVRRFGGDADARAPSGGCTAACVAGRHNVTMISLDGPPRHGMLRSRRRRRRLAPLPRASSIG